MAAPVFVCIRVENAWWLAPYLHVLAFFCWLYDDEPDWQKLDRVIRAATRFRVVRLR